MFDAAVAQFRNMDKSFKVIIDLGECAKLGQAGDLAFYQLADLVLCYIIIPRIVLELSQGESDAFAFSVDADDFYLYFLPDLQHLFGVVDMVPGNFREMHQAVGAVDIHKCTEISQAGDPARVYHALFQIFKQSRFKSFSRFL